LNFSQKIFSVFAVSVFICCATNSYCQQNDFIARNTVYADFASKGATYSLNYERILSQGGNRFSTSCRIGFTVLKNAIAMPLGIIFFTGHKASHAEFSFTAVPYIETYKDLFSGNNLSDKKMYLLPGAGYRYQKQEGGFFFKVIAGPIIYLDPPSDHFWKMDSKIYPGISAGTGFSF
jgi:hypothetical protein